jgi:hypothetical protein
MTHADIIERIKRHNPRLRKDADLRIIAGEASAKAEVTADSRDLVVVANTARIDMDNEVVVPEGGRLGYFGENRSVFFDHMYDDASFVGKVRRGYPKLVGGEWSVRFTVRRNERGDQLLRDAEDFGVSVSIGFDVLKAGEPTPEEVEQYGGGKSFGSIVREWEWAELSVTWMPSNVEARSAHPQAVAAKTRRWTLTPFGVVSPVS